MLFLIYWVDDPKMAQPDDALRATHRTYLFETFKEQLVAGGPTFEDDGKTINGRVVYGEFADRAAAEAFVKGEPYFKSGRIQRYDIKPMRMAINRGA